VIDLEKAIEDQDRRDNHQKDGGFFVRAFLSQFDARHVAGHIENHYGQGDKDNHLQKTDMGGNYAWEKPVSDKC